MSFRPSESRATSLRALLCEPHERAAFCQAHPHPFLLARDVHRRLRRVPIDTSVLLHRLHSVRSRADASPWDAVLIGRGPECDVVLEDPRVSRHHATIERDQASGEHLVLDVGSRNGVRVDGQPVSRRGVRRLRSGALVQLGSVEMIFLLAPDLYDLLSTSGRDEETLGERNR